MYYTSRGAYRKSKMVIDYLNIALSIIIGLLFLVILFLRSKSGILFPVIFLLGAVVNGTTAAKMFMDARKTSGIILAIVTLLLLLMAVLVWSAI